MQYTANRPFMMTAANNYGGASSSVIAEAKRLLPATQIDHNADGTKTVHSCKSGQEYTIDIYGRCNCLARGVCRHQIQVAMQQEQNTPAAVRPSIYSRDIPVQAPVSAATFKADWGN